MLSYQIIQTLPIFFLNHYSYNRKDLELSITGLSYYCFPDRHSNNLSHIYQNPSIIIKFLIKAKTSKNPKIIPLARL